MKPQSTTFLLTLGLVVALLLQACGQSEEVRFLDMTLSLESRDIPEETEKIYYYVLPNIVPDGSGGETSLDCHTFMGTDAVSVFDYDEFFVRRGDEEVDPLSRVDIPIFKLPVGRHIFYLEALGSTNDPLACGCGEGQIEAGEKTQVRIRMVTTCL